MQYSPEEDQKMWRERLVLIVLGVGGLFFCWPLAIIAILLFVGGYGRRPWNWFW